MVSHGVLRPDQARTGRQGDLRRGKACYVAAGQARRDKARLGRV